jgi:hypothetical protein
MKYMLLIYDDEVVFGKIAKEEQQQILANLCGLRTNSSEQAIFERVATIGGRS